MLASANFHEGTSDIDRVLRKDGIQYSIFLAQTKRMRATTERRPLRRRTARQTLSMRRLDVKESTYTKETSLVYQALGPDREKTLRQLCSATKLSLERCSQVLYMLARQGCVRKCSSKTSRKTSAAQTYKLEPQSNSRRRRVPLYLEHVRLLHGKVAEQIMFCFFTHGYLTVTEIESLLYRNQKNTQETQSIRGILERLYHSDFISVADTSQKPSNHVNDKLQLHVSFPECLEKTLWTVDFQNMNRSVCELECVKLVTRTLRDTDARILQYVHRHERALRGSNTSVLASSLSTHFLETDGLSHAEVTQSLESLKMRSYLAGAPGDQGSGGVHLNTELVTNTTHHQIVYTIVKQRFGETACRLFRLLLNSPQLEQKQISELAMIPLKDCREILGKLLKHEYVRLQEVARTTDHAPSRTNYLWKVHLPSVIVRIQLELQATYQNLESRLHEELRKENASSCASVFHACVDPRDQSETLSSAKRGLRTSVEKLELSLLRLDKMMIVFSS